MSAVEYTRLRADCRRHYRPDRRVRQDEDYRRLNTLLLRNTSVVNFLDGCAASLPIP